MSKAYIDYEKKQIIGRSGTVYRILPEMLSGGRAPEWEIRGALLGFRTDFETIYRGITEAINALLYGKDSVVGNSYAAIEKLKAIQKGLLHYQENARAPVIEFISLVTLYDGEDTAQHTEEQIRKKYEDWADIPVVDFILLASKLIPKFHEYYKERLEAAASEGSL